MIFHKKHLSSKGFSHVELLLILVVVIALSGIGYYVHKNSPTPASRATNHTAIRPLIDSTNTSSTIAPAGTYTYVNMPASNLSSITNKLTINNVANLGNTDFFWSHQFLFVNQPSSYGGAYMGLQGINKAVFSVFGWPSKEASSYCNVVTSGFDNGAYAYGGTSCLINYTLTTGHTYELEVRDVGQDANGINWIATVEDMNTGVTTRIAEINVSAAWGLLSSSAVVWTEYFNPSQITSCSQVPLSAVTFSTFTANDNQYPQPASHSDSITQNSCSSTSKINDLSISAFQQEMGL